MPRAKFVGVLQQRFGRFDPKGQWNVVVIHDLEQKSFWIATRGSSLGSPVREGCADAGRNRHGRLRRMRGRPDLLERRLEHGLLYHFDAAVLGKAATWRRGLAAAALAQASHSPRD